jgi:uncharacterized protein YaaN involved in tellurite resistance
MKLGPVMANLQKRIGVVSQLLKEESITPSIAKSLRAEKYHLEHQIYSIDETNREWTTYIQQLAGEAAANEMEIYENFPED